MATATLTWIRSVTAGIKSQTLSYTVNGGPAVVVPLKPEDQSYTFKCEPKDVIHAEIWNNDGMDSTHTIVDGTCPDAVPPTPPVPPAPPHKAVLSFAVEEEDVPEPKAHAEPPHSRGHKAKHSPKDHETNE